MLGRDLKGFAPLFYVGKPMGRSVRGQPTIGRDAIDDDSVVAKNAEEKRDVLSVESVDVIFDEGLNFSRGSSATVILLHVQFRPAALSYREPPRLSHPPARARPLMQADLIGDERPIAAR